MHTTLYCRASPCNRGTQAGFRHRSKGSTGFTAGSRPRGSTFATIPASKRTGFAGWLARLGTVQEGFTKLFRGGVGLGVSAAALWQR